MGKHLVAVKITFDFGLTEMFPPVSLLKDYVKVTTELANKTIADGKNSKKSLVLMCSLVSSMPQQIVTQMALMYVFVCRMRRQTEK